MLPNRVEELVSAFARARVLVVGDIYLDENVFGRVTSVSLEAPIPVFEVLERRHNPGAAGNAACNLAAMGAKTHMVGYVGADPNADVVLREFAARNVDVGGVVVAPDRPTNTYGKLKAGGHNIPMQEVLRTDTPAPALISGDTEEAVIARIRELAPQVDAIVVVDQVASVVTERVLEAVVSAAHERNLLTVGDSRSRIGKFAGFDVVVPNDREAGVGVGIDVTDETTLAAAADKLTRIAKVAAITRGPAGVTVYRAGEAPITRPPIVAPHEVVDVTGAGDTVTAAITLAQLAGADWAETAELANLAAGVAVRQPNVVTVPAAQILREARSAGAPAKLKTLDELREAVLELQAAGKRVVWTNGCFDILHAGHITYLQRAAACGDALIVGLNSDASVRAIKGPSRPVVPQDERAIVLAALECVRYVIIFDDPTTVPLLEALRPDVYAKGGDYTIDTIVQEERRVVESYGGAIALVPGVEGKSTTNLIQRIKT